MDQASYEPRKGTLLAALQNVPGARISIGGRMVPVAEVLAEREAEARKAEAHKRAVEARRNTPVQTRDAEAVKEAHLARQADQAIVDEANKAVGAKYDHDTIVVKIRHDKQIGQSGRVMRVYWRRGDEDELKLAPANAQALIAGCTSEQAAALAVAKKVLSNDLEVKAFYHDNGLRELVLEGPAPSGPQNSLPEPGEGRGGVDANARTAEASAAPDTVTCQGHTYRLGEPACPTEALFRVEYYPGGIPLGPRSPKVFHVRSVSLVAKGNDRLDDAWIAHCNRPIRHTDFEVER